MYDRHRRTISSNANINMCYFAQWTEPECHEYQWYRGSIYSRISGSPFCLGLNRPQVTYLASKPGNIGQAWGYAGVYRSRQSYTNTERSNHHDGEDACKFS